MSLERSSLTIKFQGGQNKTANSITTRFPVSSGGIIRFTDGTAADKAQIWVPIMANASTSGTTYALDALTHPFGTAVLTAIKAFEFRNLSTTAAESITIGAAATAPFLGWLAGSAGTGGTGGIDPSITVKPGNIFAITNNTAAGWAFTTAKNLKIVSASGTPAFEMYILGIGTLS